MAFVVWYRNGVSMMECVWLGRSMVGNWMVLSARKTHKCCKLLQNYLSVFPNRPNPCNDELRVFCVCRGWLEMDGFKCFCDGSWRFFFCLFEFTWVHLANSQDEQKKIRNCIDSLIFIHSFISFRCSTVWLPSMQYIYITKCLCEFPDLYS